MKNRDKTLRRLLSFIGSYRKNIIISVFAAFVYVLGTLIGTRLIGKAVDIMGSGNGELLGAVIAVLVVYVFSSLAQWILTVCTNSISFGVSKNMRDSLKDKMDSLPVSYYDTHAHGDLVSRFINDADSVGEALQQSLSQLLTGVITVVGAVILMLSMSPILACIVVISAPLTFYTAGLITSRSRTSFKKQSQSLGELHGYSQEIFAGYNEIITYNAIGNAQENFDTSNAVLHKNGLCAQIYSAFVNPVTRYINHIAYVAVGLVGSILVIKGVGNISVGIVTSFLLYANLFAKPFNEISGVISQIQAGIAGARRIFTVFDAKEDIEAPSNVIDRDAVKGSVEFRNVSFSYEEGKALIQNINLSVAPGSRVAIVGKTGAGKTTLVNLLMRFYDCNSGNIYIDGVDVNTLTKENVRECFGMVLQDTWLFEGRVRDNIAYGKPDATIDEIQQAAKNANAHDFIMRLEKGYDTVISDVSTQISQGQKQLLTIARVFMADPPILILDEATSNIDTYTEKKIQIALKRLMKERTSFVIAHRLSTIKDADLILVMKNGNIVEQGTHNELLDKKQEYYNLYMSQFDTV
ncbi:MAG: ABC transporter ATP-binding protein [Clostridiales bacterium]|nr:ABC transporter ATP-binding protein [Clostridiales bacterium]